MKHKLLFLALAAAIFLLIAGCSQSAPQPATPPATPAQPPAGTPSANASQTQAQSTVTIENFAFSPSTITVKAGTTVTWVNNDSAPHQIASNPHPAHTDLPGLLSGILSNGESYSFTFNQPGTFGYHCHVHPSMAGTVVVEA